MKNKKKWTTHQKSIEKIPNSKRKKRLNKRKSDKKTIELLLHSGFLIFLCVTFWLLLTIKTHIISGTSMVPTFQNEDHILIFRNQYPQRYNIITFAPSTTNPQESYVKRVIGMPNDPVKVVGKTSLLLTVKDSMESETLRITIDEKIATDLKKINKIPPNYYFVMGDNRYYSNDSRHIGLVSAHQIEGIVFFRYYPFSKIGKVE